MHWFKSVIYYLIMALIGLGIGVAAIELFDVSSTTLLLSASTMMALNRLTDLFRLGDKVSPLIALSTFVVLMTLLAIAKSFGLSTLWQTVGCVVILVAGMGYSKKLSQRSQPSQPAVPQPDMSRISRRRQTPPEPAETLSFDQIIEQHSQTAVIAYRPYPPASEKSGRSKLGGLPDLPPAASWPRITKTRHIAAGQPLHFLAQIDLAELPWRPDTCPSEGTLLFFAHIDEEMLWDDDDVSGLQSCVRVVYDRSNSGVPTLPPEDIGPIEGGWSEFDKQFATNADWQTVSYPEWPLVFGTIQTLPNPSFGRMEFSLPENYREQWTAFRQKQLEMHFGPLPSWTPHADRFPVFADTINHDQTIKKSSTLRPYAETGFPFTPVTVTLICRYLLKRLPEGSTGQSLNDSLSGWKAWADNADIGHIAPDRAQNFVEFLNSIMPGEADKRFHWHIHDAINNALHQLVVLSGSNRLVSDSIPENIYRADEKFHRIFAEPASERGPKAHLYPGETLIHHQMFGHLQSCQNISIGSEGMLLLQLFSDYGVSMMFCDVGEVDFIISRKALTHRNFDAVTAITCGG